jgi:hypothetical protein
MREIIRETNGLGVPIYFTITTFARQNDTKACIILLRIDDSSLNASSYLLKSDKKANALTESRIETP